MLQSEDTSALLLAASQQAHAEGKKVRLDEGFVRSGRFWSLVYDLNLQQKQRSSSARGHRGASRGGAAPAGLREQVDLATADPLTACMCVLLRQYSRWDPHWQRNCSRRAQ